MGNKSKSTVSKGTEATGRVADVLLEFGKGTDSLGVSEIARSLSVSKAVVYRILRTLVEKQLLNFDGKSRKYQLGPGLEGLGAWALRNSDLRTAALPWLHRLQRETGETATASLLVQESRIYIDQVESSQEIRMMVEIGRPFPLHAGSSGNSILAFLPQEFQERILAGDLKALTPRTITDPNVLRSKLVQIREVGFACSDGARQAGAGSVAAPVFGYHGAVLGAISVCGPNERFDLTQRESVGQTLVNYCAELSANMGWTKKE